MPTASTARPFGWSEASHSSAGLDANGAVPVFARARARGAEIGAHYEAEWITLTAVGFWLHLESELVFVGDAGTTEPNDATRRYGGEFSLFWRPTDALTLDTALALTDARFEGVADDRIPGSAGNVLSAGASWELLPGLVTSARVRHFGPALLTEDGSVRSEAMPSAKRGGRSNHPPQTCWLSLRQRRDLPPRRSPNFHLRSGDHRHLRIPHLPLRHHPCLGAFE